MSETKNYKKLKYICIFSVIIISFIYGVVVGQYKIFPFKPIQYLFLKNQIQIGKLFSKQPIMLGHWNVAREKDKDNKTLNTKNEGYKKLLALPYMNGYTKAPKQSNVTLYNKNKSFSGFNLYVSGHKPSAILVDMNGNVLHEWSKSYKDVWPDMPETETAAFNKTFWRRVHLFDNGDLLAIFEGIGIIKIDKNSKFIWANRCNAHHDIYVDKDGDIYTLTEQLVFKHDGLDLVNPLIDNSITILSPDGKIKKSVSLLDCFLRSKYASILLKTDFKPDVGLDQDIFHTNTLELIENPVDENNPIFKKGRVIISCRNISVIAVVDIDEKIITWAMNEMWFAQHQPSLLPNGNLLLFDNLGNSEKSRVIEFNPMTQEIAWEYQGPPDKRLFSPENGSAQRLLNGNTLITESDCGRAIEVTPANEVVWEFLNPHRAGEQGKFIATLFELIRIPPDKINCPKQSDCFNSVIPERHKESTLK